MNAKELHRLLTITAFTIGYVLIDELTATEQNAVGNFFMLIGQTLSTNSSFNFNVDWNNATNGTSVNKIDEKELLNKVKDILNKKIKKTKKNNLEPAVVVFSNVASLQMDQILSKLKNNSTLCLKAVVTATNYNWTFEKLVLHLLEEYQKNK